MTSATRSAIADDPDKLSAAVDAMARFLAHSLRIKDLTLLDADEETSVVREARRVARAEAAVPTLAQVLNDELRYRPSADELDHIEELSESYDFALEADALALRMLAACGLAEQGSETEADRPGRGRSATGSTCKQFADARALL